ncbi:MAG TPA: LPS export ABC transporter periplasmic protein LptC [Nitrospiria bacterium]|nr:LPS export ABC transporter periplasmic protein LptC [Nitrospiria bacterium]HUK57531.1 LPS export ABC transporter periplasmic protein LptC [Nitrospiria bacterium]
MSAAQFPRIFLLIFIGMLLSLLAWVLSVGIEHPQVLPSSKTLISKADIEMDGFTLKQIRNGTVEWDIRAKHAEVFEDRKEVFLKEMQAILQTAEGLQVRFSGDEGLLDTETHDFEIKKNDGDLDVSMNNGFTIRTPSMSWKDQEREIISLQPVQITAQRLLIRGDQLVVKLENQQFTVTGDVRVTAEP